MDSTTIAELMICAKLQDVGFQAYFVGGYVRDGILGIPCNDVDICTNALPSQILGLFPGSKYVEAAVAYPVVMVDGCEVATFRNEGNGLSRGNVEDIKFGATLEEDAARRDFTINALYYDPIARKVLDPTGLGLADMDSCLVRFIGDPYARIQEDPLRALRAARFALRFHFMLEDGTEAVLKATKLYTRN